MTEIFNPTLGIRDTSKNCKDFFKQNYDLFIYLLKPLVPFLLISHILYNITNSLFPEGSAASLLIIFPALILAYFQTCLAVAWHRAVIWGPKRCERINPLNPDIGVFKFMGVGALLVVATITVGIFTGIAGTIPYFLLKALSLDTLSKIAILLISIFIALFTLSFSLRASVIFPSVATNGKLGILEAYLLSKGMALKILFTPLWALLPLSLLSLIYVTGSTFIYVLIANAISGIQVTGTSGFFHITAISILQTPATIFLNSIILVIGVTILSNYYQWLVKEGNTYANPVQG